MEQLQKNLEEAILKEEYERAAQLRDEIKRVQAQRS
jgi:protein-arginine kinase activator protein McsA